MCKTKQTAPPRPQTKTNKQTKQQQQQNQGRLYITFLSYQYRNPHVKDNTASRPSYLLHRSPHTYLHIEAGPLKSGKTSNRKTSWSLEAAILVLRIFWSLYNLTNWWAVPLTRCLPNFKAMWWFRQQALTTNSDTVNITASQKQNKLQHLVQQVEKKSQMYNTGSCLLPPNTGWSTLICQ